MDGELPLASEAPFGAPRRPLRKRIGSAFAGLAALAAKFGAYLKTGLLLLPKLALLSTAGTALISIAAYSLLWGWTFAAGFVALLFVHEMGHVIQLRREGIKASTPMFIPFLGAAIFSRSLGDNALAEARVGLAGPILGTLGAVAVAVAGALTNSDLLLALAYFAFFLNLINLIPVVPFDGGRAMAAVAPSMWFVGIGGLVAMVFLLGNPFLLIFILLALREMPRRWRQLRSHSIEQARLLPRAASQPDRDRTRLRRANPGAWNRYVRDSHPRQRRAQLPINLNSATSVRTAAASSADWVRFESVGCSSGQDRQGHMGQRDGIGVCMGPRRLAVIALTATTVTIAGCGGSEKPLTHAELVSKANAICKTVTAKFATKSANSVQDIARIAPELA